MFAIWLLPSQPHLSQNMIDCVWDDKFFQIWAGNSLHRVDVPDVKSICIEMKHKWCILCFQSSQPIQRRIVELFSFSGDVEQTQRKLAVDSFQCFFFSECDHFNSLIGWGCFDSVSHEYFITQIKMLQLILLLLLKATSGGLSSRLVSHLSARFSRFGWESMVTARW